MLMPNSIDYYELLAEQQQNDLLDQLKTLEFTICYHQRIVEQTKKLYYSQLESLKELRRQHSLIDLELAKTDGRFVQCESPKTILTRKRQEERKQKTTQQCQSFAEIAKNMSEEEKRNLVRILMS